MASSGTIVNGCWILVARHEHETRQIFADRVAAAVESAVAGDAFVHTVRLPPTAWRLGESGTSRNKDAHAVVQALRAKAAGKFDGWTKCKDHQCQCIQRSSRCASHAAKHAEEERARPKRLQGTVKPTVYGGTPPVTHYPAAASTAMLVASGEAAADPATAALCPRIVSLQAFEVCAKRVDSSASTCVAWVD
jgi:hypothetical protein